MNRDIDSMQDVIDVSAITEHVDELRGERDALREDAEAEDGADTVDAAAALAEWEEGEDAEELARLESLLDELRGYGGDHQWEGDWYPGYLIRDSYFEEYAQTLAEDIGAIDPNANWPLGCIDWAQAARELQVDYSTVEFDGVTYWYR